MTDAIELLWRRATIGIPTRSVDAKRSPDGNYVVGYRNDIDTWMHEEGGHRLNAIKTEWQTFNLAADSEGTRRSLEIKQDDRVIFEAIQEGPSVRTEFSGADERYQGKQHIAAQPWQIVHGEIPTEFK